MPADTRLLVGTAFRVYEDSLPRADALAVNMREATMMPATRTAILRAAIDLGLDELERRHKSDGVKKARPRK